MPSNSSDILPTDEDFIRWAENDCNVLQMEAALRLKPELVNILNVC